MFRRLSIDLTEPKTTDDQIDSIEAQTGVRYKILDHTASPNHTAGKEDEYNKLLQKQRELEGLRPAIRDPKTGYVWSHPWSHSDVPRAPQDEETKERLANEWRHETKNVGFADKGGNFLSREDAWNKYGFVMRESLDELKDDLRSTIRRFHGSKIVAYFPATDRMQKNFDGKWEIYLRNPTRNKIGVALEKAGELRWVYYQGVSYWVNSHLTTHFDLAQDVGEPHAQNAIGGRLTKQMFDKIPPGADMREWEMDHATAVR